MRIGIQALLANWLHARSAPAVALGVIGLLLANAAVSTLCAVLTHCLLPSRLRARISAGRNILALATLGSILPLLGPPLLLIIGLLYPRFEKDAHRPRPRVVRQPTYAAEVRGHVSRFGAGGALARLRTAPAQGGVGSRALLAIATRRSRETTHLLREALSHPDESLRLLAHNLLARREETIIAQMNRLQEHRRLHGGGAPQISLDLAELHLEFVYLGIVSGGLLQMHLEAAGELIAAIGEPPADAPWRSRLLLVRARLNQQRRPAVAEDDIIRDYELARAAGAAPARALPWMLESAWQARDYGRLRRLLERNPLYRHIPLIGPVARIWGYALDG